jgi:hypothetical protein
LFEARDLWFEVAKRMDDAREVSVASDLAQCITSDSNVADWIPVLAFLLLNDAKALDGAFLCVRQKADTCFRDALQHLPRKRFCGVDIELREDGGAVGSSSSLAETAGFSDQWGIAEELAAVLVGWGMPLPGIVHLEPGLFEMGGDRLSGLASVLVKRLLSDTSSTTTPRLDVRLVSSSPSSSWVSAWDACAIVADDSQDWFLRAFASGSVLPTYPADFLRALGIPTEIDEASVSVKLAKMGEAGIVPPPGWAVGASCKWLSAVSSGQGSIASLKELRLTRKIFIDDRWIACEHLILMKESDAEGWLDLTRYCEYENHASRAGNYSVIIEPDLVDQLRQLPEFWGLHKKFPLSRLVAHVLTHEHGYFTVHFKSPFDDKDVADNRATIKGLCMALRANRQKGVLDMAGSDDIETLKNLRGNVALCSASQKWVTFDHYFPKGEHQLDAAYVVDEVDMSLQPFYQELLSIVGIEILDARAATASSATPGAVSSAGAGLSPSSELQSGAAGSVTMRDFTNFVSRGKAGYAGMPDFSGDGSPGLMARGMAGEILMHVFFSLSEGSYDPYQCWLSMSRKEGLDLLRDFLRTLEPRPSDQVIELLAPRVMNPDAVVPMDDGLGFDFSLQRGARCGVERVEVKTTAYQNKAFKMTENEKRVQSSCARETPAVVYRVGLFFDFSGANFSAALRELLAAAEAGVRGGDVPHPAIFEWVNVDAVLVQPVVKHHIIDPSRQPRWGQAQRFAPNSAPGGAVAGGASSRQPRWGQAQRQPRPFAPNSAPGGTIAGGAAVSVRAVGESVGYQGVGLVESFGGIESEYDAGGRHRERREINIFPVGADGEVDPSLRSGLESLLLNNEMKLGRAEER